MSQLCGMIDRCADADLVFPLGFSKLLSLVIVVPASSQKEHSLHSLSYISVLLSRL